MTIQLKASDSFISILTKVKSVKALILCEGSSDAETLKSLARRLGLKLDNTAITDAEGISVLSENLLPALLALIVGKVVSRPKPIATIIDADRAAPREKARNLANSLEARGYRILEDKPVCNNVWNLKIRRDNDEVHILVAINGVFQEPFTTFETHELEDHFAYLKLLENKLTREDVLRAKRARELVTPDDLKILNNADIVHIREAFQHMTCLLSAIASTPSLSNHLQTGT